MKECDTWNDSLPNQCHASFQHFQFNDDLAAVPFDPVMPIKKERQATTNHAAVDHVS